MKNKLQPERDGEKGVSGKHQTPSRVAHRLEGVVKNKGIKPVKKGRSIHREL
jgi:hypothetical protein